MQRKIERKNVEENIEKKGGEKIQKKNAGKKGI